MDTNLTAIYSKNIGTQDLYYKDKMIFLAEMARYGRPMGVITNDLVNFNSFTEFMIREPAQAPYKLGIYIKKIMRFDNSAGNDIFHHPYITHKNRSGDCDDAANLCQFFLTKAGYTRPINDFQLPLPVLLSDGSIINSLKNSGFAFPLMIGISVDPLSTPIEKVEFHGICVFEELKSNKLNVLDTRYGLTRSKTTTLIDLISKFDKNWQRMVIMRSTNGIVDPSKPYIIILRSDAKKPNSTFIR